MLFTIHNVVYDLTGFADHHPGGAEVFSLLQARAAQTPPDVTALLEVYHDKPKDILQTILPKYRVGDAPPSSFPTFTYERYHQLKREVHDMIRRQGLDRGYSLPEALYHVFFVTVYVCTFYNFLACPSWHLTFLLIALVAWWASNLLHELSHKVHWRKDRATGLRVLTQVASPFMDMDGWFFDHVFLHHSFTNTTHDPDVSGIPSLLRFLPRFVRLPQHVHQHMYVFPLSLLAVFSKALLPSLLYRVNRVSLTLFLFILWCCRHHLNQFFLLYTVPGPLFIVPALLNHVQHEHLTHIRADGKDFLVHQLQTTSNYQSSFLTRMLSFNLDIQIEHHLFPNIAHSTLRKIRPVVREFCRQHDLPYIERPGMANALKDMIRTMWRLGNVDDYKQQNRDLDTLRHEINNGRQ